MPLFKKTRIIEEVLQNGSVLYYPQYRVLFVWFKFSQGAGYIAEFNSLGEAHGFLSEKYCKVGSRAHAWTVKSKRVVS